MALRWWPIHRYKRSHDGIIVSDRRESAIRFLAALLAAGFIVAGLHHWKLAQPLIAARLMVDSAVTRFAAAWPLPDTVQHSPRLTKVFVEFPTDFAPACGSLQALVSDAFALNGEQLFLAATSVAEDSILWWQAVPDGIALRVQGGTVQLSLAVREGSKLQLNDEFDERQNLVAPAFCTIALELHRDGDESAGLPTVTLSGRDFGRFFQDLPIREMRTLGFDLDAVQARSSSLRQGQVHFLETAGATTLFRGDLPYLRSPSHLATTIVLEGGILSLEAVGPVDVVALGRRDSITDLRPSQVEYFLGETDPVYFLLALTLMPILGILLDIWLQERPLFQMLGGRRARQPLVEVDSDDPGRME